MANDRYNMKFRAQNTKNLDTSIETERTKFDYFYIPYEDLWSQKYVRPMKLGVCNTEGNEITNKETNFGWNKVSKFVLYKDSQNLRQFIKFVSHTLNYISIY